MPEHSTTVSLPAIPLTPTDRAWDEAFLRVESYLHAHRVESRVQLNELVTEIIVEARTLESASPGDDPVAYAMQATHARIAAWFARAGTGSDWANEGDRAHGRLALVIADLPGRWANCFLSAESVPPALAAAMASFQFQPGPELRFSNMPTAPLEFGFDETDDPHATKRGVWSLVRSASSSLLVVALIGAAWVASH
jgi:hypothetical protein